jgi:hypothetical protein
MREEKLRDYAEPASGNGMRVALAAGIVAVLLSGCGSQELRVRKGEDIRMGPYTLRVTSADSYSRAHQGVPWEVEIKIECKGGNRFERIDFTEALSRRGKVHFSNGEGWRERSWLLARGDDRSDFVIHANPPTDSTGMVLEISNPYGGGGNPDRILVDLGR